MPKRHIFQSILSISCVGLLASSGILLGGCMGSKSKVVEKKEPKIQMEVVQVDQLSALGDKEPDGQFLVARAHLKNLANKSILMQPGDFKLENITEDEKERYSQPAEKNIARQFTDTYGKDLKDKLVDIRAINLYPRMNLERYFVFMVPSNAKIDGYQITFVPEKVSTPLVVTGITAINDHRNSNEFPAAE